VLSFDYLKNKFKKAEAEIRASLMKERLLFLEEDRLSTNFENQLTLMENERVRKLQVRNRENLFITQAVQCSVRYLIPSRKLIEKKGVERRWR
jgi:hypothetical protein